jgi:hypothetical protein
MCTDRARLQLRLHHTNDVGSYLDRVDGFLRHLPVEHSVLLSVATSRLGQQPVEGAEPHLWLWAEDGGEVVAAAQYTPPHGPTSPLAGSRRST